jgi:hypothetical protein
LSGGYGGGSFGYAPTKPVMTDAGPRPTPVPSNGSQRGVGGKGGDGGGNPTIASGGARGFNGWVSLSW